MKKQTSSTKKMYIVKYYGGSYEDSYTRIVFVTDKKSTEKRKHIETKTKLNELY
jgi:hypothetical protein